MVEIGLIRPTENKTVNTLSLQHLSDTDKSKYLKLASGHYGLFQEMLKGSRGVCFVARDGGEVIGYATGYPASTELTKIKYAELDGLYVSSSYRSLGIGKKLVEAFILWAKNNHMQRVKLVTGWRNQAEILGFYKEIGFIPMSISMELHFD
jgi:ribosomal protein S18 acetylase RimI-like enzyme